MRVGSAQRSRATRRRAITADRARLRNAVARFGALGTYLANLRDETMRVQYTELTVAAR